MREAEEVRILRGDPPPAEGVVIAGRAQALSAERPFDVPLPERLCTGSGTGGDGRFAYLDRRPPRRTGSSTPGAAA
ncbi:hypothetical protein [Streptomyces sp. NRRL F-4474]|uniref:hypothetical protein n=1 Tax=Streptomyces sp. NRRL F-4474 TaxID=1463851 RepID=UPI00131CB671|nr:hypothetical protein [Streptomyces sp. NRRL F-4474]